MSLQRLPAVLALLCVFNAAAADYPVACLSADYVICEGPPAFMGTQGVTTLRIGANSNNSSPSGRNAVVIFPMPVLAAGEQVSNASLTVNVAGRSGAPTFNVDLWGIGFQTSTAAIVEYFEGNTGDAGNTKLQDNVITPSFTSGDVTLANHAGLAVYLQTFYAANSNYAGGSYVFLRMNPDADSGTTSLGWSISAAESGTPAVLTVSTVGGPTNLPPTITQQPQSQTVMAASNVSFTVTAAGPGTLGYNWRFNGVPMIDGGRISGTTTAVMNINSAVANDAGSFSVVVTNQFGAVTSAVATLTVLAATTNNYTNILVIISDDQRWDSLGVVQREMGAKGRFPWYTNGTPNLDRIGMEGVRFRNAFVGLSLCSPSRASILTGRYNHLNGIIDNSTAFPTSSVTYASKLQQAGYVTGMIGKWHMGSQTARPGFTFSASYVGQGNYSNQTFLVNGVSTPTSGWVDDVSTEYALGFINTNINKRFALHIGYKSTHSPREYPSWANSLYTTSVSRDVPNLNVPPPYRTNIAADSESSKRTYHRCLTVMDVDVGRILDHLDETGLASNTLVIFMGDNGYYLGEHGLGDKRSLYEESWRVPLMVRYPRLITQPAARDEMVLNIDIAPTILDIAGIAIPPDMQGRSWRPLFTGGAVPDWRQSILGEYILENGYAIPTTVAVRTTTSKLVLWPGNPSWSEMFDLTADPYEVTNLFNNSAKASMRDTLYTELDRLSRDLGLSATLTNYMRGPGNFQLTFSGGLGPRYQLLKSANLQSWIPAAEIKMTSQQMNATDTNANAPGQFYRAQWIGD
jgi:arylsulfatase A-like enzyme